MSYLSSAKRCKEKGFILITTLIFMFMLTVLALSLVSTNSTQTQIAANMSDANITFQKTEGALNQAINLILNNNYAAGNFLLNNNGLYTFNPNNAPLWETVDWTNSGAVISSFDGATGTSASYIIEQLPSVVAPGQNAGRLTRIYRVTGQASGQNPNSRVMLQATVQIQQ